MSDWHPREVELAQVSETKAGGELADHLRHCFHCRGVAADYEWLDRHIAAGLDAGLEEVLEPEPKWDVVRGRLRPIDPPIEVGHLVAVAGATAVALLMLTASLVWSGHARAEGAAAPVMVAVPVPVPAYEGDGGPVTPQSLNTTPGSTDAPHAPGVSLPFLPPPEPPEPEA